MSRSDQTLFKKRPIITETAVATLFPNQKDHSINSVLELTVNSTLRRVETHSGAMVLFPKELTEEW